VKLATATLESDRWMRRNLRQGGKPMTRLTSLRSLLLAGACGSLFAIAPVHAQQPAQPAPAAPQAGAPAQPPPSWAVGRPQSEQATKLAPVAPLPLPTAADKLPLDKLKVPKGFKLEVYASGVPNARTLRLGDKGTVFVSNRIQDKIYAIVDKGGKREVKVVASGLHAPNGIALHKGTLYIAELPRISKIENIEAVLDNPPKPTVIYDDLPKDEPHGWKFLVVGPDNKLYFNVGAPCNICMPSDQHAQIRRIDLDGKNMEVVARGIRQIVGMDFHPTLKTLYWSENARDWLSEDVPEDELNRLVNPGKEHFGYPYCHQGNLPDQEFGWGHTCDEFTKPIALLGPHSASLGMRFYTGNMFPADYRGNIILARHGSWNRSKKFGGDVVLIKLNKNGLPLNNWDVPGPKRTDTVPIVTGFIQNNSYVGRPVDVLQMKDGSLLISDDFNGAVYRLSYAGTQTAAAQR
jgi:glucose/arabinose dehydrogenase